MIMPPLVRKFALTAHVIFSVGWLGAIAVFLALAVVGLTSQDARAVRAVYLVMEPAARYTLVPLALASLLSGLVQSLGTTWGLFRHYWVLFKLAINVFATFILLTYMETFRIMASVAADPRADLASVRNPSPMLHAALALVLLLVATVLAVYKPKGLTPYGARILIEGEAIKQTMSAQGSASVDAGGGYLLGAYKLTPWLQPVVKWERLREQSASDSQMVEGRVRWLSYGVNLLGPEERLRLQVFWIARSERPVAVKDELVVQIKAIF